MPTTPNRDFPEEGLLARNNLRLARHPPAIVGYLQVEVAFPTSGPLHRVRLRGSLCNTWWLIAGEMEFINGSPDYTGEVAPGCDVTDNPQVYRTSLFRCSG